jgi:hypothetical protein
MNEAPTRTTPRSFAALLASATLLAACGSKDAPTSAASASTSPSMASKPSSVASLGAAEPAPAPAVGQKISVDLGPDKKELGGDFDGAHVLYQKRSGGTLKIRFPKDCPAFCTTYFDDSMAKACPKGTSAENLDDVPDKVGKAKVAMRWQKLGGEGYDTRDVEIEITETTEKEIRGKITKNQGGHSISGTFFGTHCRNPE